MILFLDYAIMEKIINDDVCFGSLVCLSAVGGRHGMDIAQFGTTLLV